MAAQRGLAATAALFACCSVSLGQNLIWADEFDALDLGVWQPQIGNGDAFDIPGWGNNELQYYTSRNSNLRVEDGVLVIEARREPFAGFGYTSARLRTIGEADFGYGRYEARIQIPSTPGIWPAFWMLPTDSPYGGWPMGGEIDIMESINFADRIYGTIHFGNPWPGNRSWGRSTGGEDFGEGFHVYRVDRYPDRMEWFVDDRLYARVHSTEWFTSAAPLFVVEAPFDHQRFHFLLNVAVGGNFPCSDDRFPCPPGASSEFPAQMRVDWVRVYELDNFQQPFDSGVQSIPGVVEAERYDYGGQGRAFHDTDIVNQGALVDVTFRPNESVDTERRASGGFHVGWIDPGEWIEYTVDVAHEGLFDMVASVASDELGGVFRLELDGEDVTGPVSFDNTGGWQTFVEVTRTVRLESGRRVLRFVNLGGPLEGFNIDRFEFVAVESAPCSEADLTQTAGAFGTIDGNDIAAFVSGFLSRDPSTDIATTGGVFGQHDGNDISLFVSRFLAGCP